jgi:hypothetical protein
MKHCSRNILLAVFILSLAGIIHAQSSTTVEGMRSQLSDIQKKEAEFQERVRQLDEDLKPENIEHSLAPFGSTRPEELREQRRQQLESEKKNVQSQLDQLATSRTRLETAIANAESTQYRQSALPVTTNPSSTEGTSNLAAKPKQIQRRARHRRARRAKRRG